MWNIAMKLSVISGLLITGGSAATWNRRTASGFQLKASSGVYPIISALDAALPNQKVADIIADTNHVCPNTPVVPRPKPVTDSYTWPNGADFDDRGTKAWYP